MHPNTSIYHCDEMILMGQVVRRSIPKSSLGTKSGVCRPVPNQRLAKSNLRVIRSDDSAGDRTPLVILKFDELIVSASGNHSWPLIVCILERLYLP